jgi:hypothetical protein
MSIPTTFVWGDRDQLISPRFAGPVATNLPTARQILMPCVAHWWNGPHHRCLAEALADLLQDPEAIEPIAPRRAGELPTRPCLVEPGVEPDGRDAMPERLLAETKHEHS